MQKILVYISFLIITSCSCNVFEVEIENKTITNSIQTEIDLSNEYALANSIYTLVLQTFSKEGQMNIDSLNYFFNSSSRINSQLKGIVVVNSVPINNNKDSLIYMKSDSLKDEGLCIPLINFKDTIINDNKLTFGLCYNGMRTDSDNKKYYSCDEEDCKFIISVSDIIFPTRKLNKLYFVDDEYGYSTTLVQCVFKLDNDVVEYFKNKEYYPDQLNIGIQEIIIH